YWGMGMVCTLEEAHAALGDMLPFIQNCTDYRTAKGHSFREAYLEGSKEGPLLAARRLLLRQLGKRFGPRPDAADNLAKVDSLDRLESLANDVLAIADWQAFLSQLT